MCCLGNRWQVRGSRKPLPPRSRPPTPRALAIWHAGTARLRPSVRLSTANPPLLPASWKSRKDGSSRLSRRIQPCLSESEQGPQLRQRWLSLPGLKPGSAALGTGGFCEPQFPLSEQQQLRFLEAWTTCKGDRGARGCPQGGGPTKVLQLGMVGVPGHETKANAPECRIHRPYVSGRAKDDMRSEVLP